MAKTTECVSCGKEASPNSERGFCADCDAHFDAGLQRQKEVEARAEKLEEAKAKGDADTVGQLMTEIFKESVVQEQAVPTPVSSATAQKVEG